MLAKLLFSKAVPTTYGTPFGGRCMTARFHFCKPQRSSSFRQNHTASFLLARQGRSNHSLLDGGCIKPNPQEAFLLRQADRRSCPGSTLKGGDKTRNVIDAVGFAHAHSGDNSLANLGVGNLRLGGLATAVGVPLVKTDLEPAKGLKGFRIKVALDSVGDGGGVGHGFHSIYLFLCFSDYQLSFCNFIVPQVWSFVKRFFGISKNFFSAHTLRLALAFPCLTLELYHTFWGMSRGFSNFFESFCFVTEYPQTREPLGTF